MSKRKNKKPRILNLINQQTLRKTSHKETLGLFINTMPDTLRMFRVCFKTIVSERK